jgi:hypothetical protein
LLQPREQASARQAACAQKRRHGVERGLDPRFALARYQHPRQPLRVQQTAQQIVDRLAHVRAVALQAVGHPGQVERGQQRQPMWPACSARAGPRAMRSPKTMRL